VEFRDYYKTLGIAGGASQPEVKRAYRRLARKYHPDVSKEADAEKRFIELTEAYEVLNDPEKRAAYDRLRSGGVPSGDFRPPPDWDAGFEFRGGGFTSADTSRFSEFFESLFGRGFAGFRSDGVRFRGRGRDHHARVLIDMEESFAGGSREIALNVPEIDDRGFLVNRTRRLKVRIPKGIRSGQQIRLAGQGAVAPGQGEPGDLYLTIEFKPHRLYRPDGRDLHLDLPVAPWEAALGTSVRVPTPAGPVEMKIPPGSASGDRMRLRGRGLPASPPGDLYAQLRVVLPAAGDQRARELYRQMARDMAFDPRAGMGGC